MSEQKNMTQSHPLWGNKNAIAVDRAAADIRRGLPVLIHNTTHAIAILSAETLEQPALESAITIFEKIKEADGHLGVLISPRRAETLHIATKGMKALFLERTPEHNLRLIKAIADPTLDLTYPLKGPFETLQLNDEHLGHGACALLKIAQLLPAGLALYGPKESLFKAFDGENILHINVQDIESYKNDKIFEMVEVARTNVPLENAENTHLISFRPRSGGVENIALLINNPDTSKPVLTRLHSECFTGDFLGSLKCDCGDQLKGAIAEIEQAGSGVLLYLAQEGRGLGLNAKLKAYTLQEQGFDTVDANLKLGFEIDERIYAPAAVMLKMLNISTVRLMTNNPKKVAALEACGIHVKKRVGHHFPTNKHNENYLLVKKERTGHYDN